MSNDIVVNNHLYVCIYYDKNAAVRHNRCEAVCKMVYCVEVYLTPLHIIFKQNLIRSEGGTAAYYC